MNPVIARVVRRAILDLLNDIGGEHNDEELTMLLVELGHPVARRAVAEQLAWLGDAKLVICETMGGYEVARIVADGRDVAEGRLAVEGVSPHKTGE